MVVRITVELDIKSWNGIFRLDKNYYGKISVSVIKVINLKWFRFNYRVVSDEIQPFDGTVTSMVIKTLHLCTSPLILINNGLAKFHYCENSL